MTMHITKTWFDGEKVVTQEIPESEIYKQEPVAWEQFHEHMAGPFYKAPHSQIGLTDEPVAWMFQHEETGRTMCVDTQQLELGFEKGNPRLKKIAPLYTAPPQRWVGLTDEEIETFVAHLYPLPEKPVKERLQVLLTKLQERNT